MLCTPVFLSFVMNLFAYPNLIIVKVVKTVNALIGSCYLIVTERSICNCFLKAKYALQKYS